MEIHARYKQYQRASKLMHAIGHLFLLFQQKDTFPDCMSWVLKENSVMHSKPGKKPDKKDDDKKKNHAIKPSGRFIFISLYHHLTCSMKFMIKCKIEF